MYPYGPYIGLPSNAQPIIGECASLTPISLNDCVTGSNTTLSPTTYLSSFGSDICAYSPPYWLLNPVNTYPLATSYFDASSYSRFLFHWNTFAWNVAS